MKKIFAIFFTLIFTFVTIGSSYSFAYGVNEILSTIEVQYTSEGILYTIGDDWELLETENGTVFNKMPSSIEENLNRKYLVSEKNSLGIETINQKSFFSDILISFALETIAKLVWNGTKWVAVSLVTGNPVPAAVAVLAVTIAGIATMTVVVIYMVGTYQSPSADRVQSTSGCISRDGGITWICPYRYAF